MTPGRNVIRIGTDCSGMEAPIQAMQNLGLPHRHVFSSDTDKYVRKTIQENFKPEKVYEDVMRRDNSKTEHVDIYVAGFPCQPFSVAGKRQGVHDTKGRGVILDYLLDYIKKQQPKFFILENVKGFTTLENGRHMRAVIKSLEAIRLRGATSSAYDVYHHIMNTKDDGLPQSRPRWYCVGIKKGTLKEARDFVFPRPIGRPSIDTLLDAGGDSAQRLAKRHHQAEANLQKAMKGNEKSGFDPKSETMVVDCDASPQRTGWMPGISSCLSRSRHWGHWLTTKNRRMTINEMLRLQGMEPATFKSAVPEIEVGRQIGNAMSVNVVERLLLSILKHIGCVSSSTEDRWESGSAQQVLSKSCKGIARGDSKHRIVSECVNQAAIGKVRKLIVDSGASMHLVDKQSLTKT